MNSKFTLSYYKNVRDKEPRTISLEKLVETIRSSKTLSRLCVNLQSLSSKKERTSFKESNFPAVTVSGTFQKGHAAKDLVQHSGLIQIDFDEVDNLSLLTKKIAKDKHTFVSFRSPSGNGLKVFVKIDPEQHLTSFKTLQEYYATKYKVQIDEKCKDIGRLCFLSSDPEIFYNPSAITFQSIERNIDKSIIDQVEEIADQARNRRIDLTDGYQNWLKIGFALADGLGEAGRNVFHQLSSYHSDYNYQVCDKQFSQCLKGRNSGVTIKSLFHIANQKGIKVLSNSSAKSQQSSKPQPTQKDFSISEDKPSIASPDHRKENLPYIIQVENFLADHFEFRNNIILNRIECRSKTDDGKPWKEVNENEICRYLEHNHYKFNLTRTTSLLGSDFVQKYNPFKQYFDNLPPFDSRKESSPIAKLCNCIIAQEQDRFNAQLKKMLVRCVACCLTDSTNNDNFNKHVFVFVSSRQSSGKSTLCRWLCPPGLKDYFTENIPFGDKDGQLALTQNFLINLDELASLSKYDIAQLKTFISKSSVNVRPPYGRRQVAAPRRANFVGSTNNSEFLTDDTGNVRWLCFEIDSIDFGYSNRHSPNYVNIDLLWSEAYQLYKEGFVYKLTSQEIEENENANKQFEVESTEEQLIKKYFISTDKNKDNFKTSSEVVQFFLLKGYNTNRLSPEKIGKVLNKLGFAKGQEFNGISQRKGYYLKEITI